MRFLLTNHGWTEEFNKSIYDREIKCIINNLNKFENFIFEKINQKNTDGSNYNTISFTIFYPYNETKITASIVNDRKIVINTHDYEFDESSSNYLDFYLNLSKKNRLPNRYWKDYQSLTDKKSREYKQLNYHFEISNIFNENNILISYESFFHNKARRADALSFWRIDDNNFNDLNLFFSYKDYSLYSFFV